jgi:hypothetical protein
MKSLGLLGRGIFVCGQTIDREGSGGFSVADLCSTWNVSYTWLPQKFQGRLLSVVVLSLFRMIINFKKTYLFLYKVLYIKIKCVILLHTNTGTGNRTDYDYGFITI